MKDLSPRDERALRFAGSELRRVLRVLSMGELAGRIHLELLGRTQSAGLGDLGTDGFAIVPEAGEYRIVSRCVRGLVYGAYCFLESLGCRWYFPGPDGEYLPPRPAAPPDHVVIESPHTAHRSLVAFWDRTGPQRQQRIRENLDFAVWSRYSRFYLHWPQGLRFAHRLAWEHGHGLDIGVKLQAARQLLPARLFGSHPEWFRLADGKRRPDYNLCVSNAQGLAEVSRSAGKLAGSLQVDITDFAYWQDDVPNAWCQCPRCANLSSSEQNLQLMKAILEGVRAAHPRARVSYLAYYGTAAPPQSRSISKGLFLEFAPHAACYRHQLDDPQCPKNAPLVHSLKQNLRRFGVESARVFEYWLGLALFSSYRSPVRRLPLMPERMWHDVQFYRGLGLAEIENVQWMPPAEAASSPEVATPGYALLPRLLWNPRQNLAGFLRDFSRTFYGSELALAVLQLVAQADCANPRYICTPHDRGDGPGKAARCLEQAVARCQGVEATVEGRLASLHKSRSPPACMEGPFWLPKNQARGITMHASYLPLFCIPGSSAEVRFRGARGGEELLEGKLLSRGQEVGQITDGVACFCEEGWSAEGLQGLWKVDGLWERNWRGSISRASAGAAQQACDELAAIGGIILELAVGPGGGCMPAVLHRHPAAQIIANDHSIAILRRWREFLAEMKAMGKVCFAAFDARAAVLRDASVAAVSGVGAFGNIGGRDIFSEAYRVLRPGGLLFSMDQVVDPDDWQRLPEEFRMRWEGCVPGMTKGTSGLLQEAGFCIASCQLQGGWALDPEEADLPNEASKHGVTLHVVGEYVKASKPRSVPRLIRGRVRQV